MEVSEGPQPLNTENKQMQAIEQKRRDSCLQNTVARYGPEDK